MTLLERTGGSALAMSIILAFQEFGILMPPVGWSVIGATAVIGCVFICVAKMRSAPVDDPRRIPPSRA